MADWIDVCAANALAAGERILVDLPSATAIVCNVAGEYYAIENICSHDGATIDDGIIDGMQIVCPRHGARFCLKTGAVTCPPAYEAIASFPVRIHQGRIQTQDNRWD